MSKNKIWLGIILSIILLVFSINGFTAYYKYTQESGANFYVGIADKADALEDSNEVRQILDDLGNLLGHSKRDDLYPKNGTTGGYLGRLNYGLDASKPAVPAVNDMYLATDIVKVYRCFVVGNWVEVYPGAGGATTFLELSDTPANYTGGSLKFARVNEGETALEFGTIDLSLYYLKTEIDALSKLENIYTKDIIDSDELATLKFTDLADTPANYTGQAGKYVKVNAGETDLEFGTPAGGATTFLGLTDTPSSYTGKAGEILRVNATPNAVEFSGVGIETTLTVDSDTKIPTSKAVNDFCETTKDYMQNLEDDTIPYLGGHLRLNENSIYINANLSNDHTYSGLLDYQVVGESVVFGDLLYFDWTTKRWKKADADLAANMPGLRIAVEPVEADQSCNMLAMGYIRDDNWDFTGAMVYSSATAGGVTSTAPSGTGQQLQRVGVAKSADILFFDPSIDVGEI